MSDIKQQLQSDMKQAMKAKEKDRLNTIRLILAAVKQKEVDERVEVTDPDMLVSLDKLAKQRKESIAQFEKAGRDDLKAQEALEYEIIASYLPAPFSEEEVSQHIQEAIVAVEASSIKDMGKVMAQLKPILQGRADMSAVSQKIKTQLAG